MNGLLLILTGLTKANDSMMELSTSNPKLSEAELDLLAEFAKRLEGIMEKTTDAHRIALTLHRVGTGKTN